MNFHLTCQDTTETTYSLCKESNFLLSREHKKVKKNPLDMEKNTLDSSERISPN